MPKSDIKKISVVLCTYNGAKYLKEQLDTIIGQTYPVYELIVQDDGSTDNTTGIIEEYQARYPFVKLFRNEGKKGINNNFFSAIERATGDFIALSDQDDLWEADKLECQVASIGESLLSAGISKPFIDGEDKTQIHFDTRSPNICLERIIYVAMIAGHTMMFRRELIDKIPDIPRWSEHYLYDHMIQIVAAAHESINYCPYVLVNQRKHSEGATFTKPHNYKRSLSNIFASLSRTYKQYKAVRPQIREYFAHTYTLLKSTEASTISRKNALKLSGYESQQSFFAFIRLTLLCVRLRNRIFHTKEKNPFMAIARAIYFPISCSDYFQHLKK